MNEKKDRKSKGTSKSKIEISGAAREEHKNNGVVKGSRVLAKELKNPGRAKPKRPRIASKGVKITNKIHKGLLVIKEGLDPETVRQMARDMILKEPLVLARLKANKSSRVAWPVAEKIYDFKFVHQGPGRWGSFYRPILKIVREVEDQLRSELSKAPSEPGS